MTQFILDVTPEQGIWVVMFNWSRYN